MHSVRLASGSGPHVSKPKTGRTYLRPLKSHGLAEKMETGRGWGWGKGRGISSQGKPRSQ